jgi:hypothetical protein
MGESWRNDLVSCDVCGDFLVDVVLFVLSFDGVWERCMIGIDGCENSAYSALEVWIDGDRGPHHEGFRGVERFKTTIRTPLIARP